MAEWKNCKKYKLSVYYSVHLLSVFTQRYKNSWKKDGNEGECNEW